MEIRISENERSMFHINTPFGRKKKRQIHRAKLVLESSQQGNKIAKEIITLEKELLKLKIEAEVKKLENHVYAERNVFLKLETNGRSIT